MKVLLITVYLLYYSLCVDNECVDMILVGMIEIVETKIKWGKTVQKVFSLIAFLFVLTLIVSVWFNYLENHRVWGFCYVNSYLFYVSFAVHLFKKKNHSNTFFVIN